MVWLDTGTPPPATPRPGSFRRTAVPTFANMCPVPLSGVTYRTTHSAGMSLKDNLGNPPFSLDSSPFLLESLLVPPIPETDSPLSEFPPPPRTLSQPWGDETLVLCYFALVSSAGEWGP